jgi:hypothetical protein
MRSTEARIERLEARLPSKDTHASGSLSREIREALDEQSRKVFYRLVGFDIEEIKPRPTLGRVLSAEALWKSAGQNSALISELQALDHERRTELAAKRGYKILYPPGIEADVESYIRQMRAHGK